MSPAKFYDRGTTTEGMLREARDWLSFMASVIQSGEKLNAGQYAVVHDLIQRIDKATL